MDGLAAADELGLLPTPREIELTEDYQSLAGWDITVASDHPYAEIAVSEITDRLVELGADPVPTTEPPIDGPTLLLGRWLDPGIREAAMALDVAVGPDDPGAEGYVIAFGEYADHPIILLAGADAQGMLYAAVTVRRLLTGNPPGKEDEGVAARTVYIRDWPDFDVRNVARLSLSRLGRTDATLADLSPLEEAADALKREIDGWLRHKVNCLSTGFFFPDADTDPELAEHQARKAAEVATYAADRGISLRLVGGVDIEKYLTAEQQENAVQRAPGSHYEWSALAAHRTHAARYGHYVDEIGGDIFSLHLDDQGGYHDPERWSERSEATREMYGDDQAAATTDQFALYYQRIDDLAGGIEREAIPYPYHFQFAREDFADRYDTWRDSPALAGLIAAIDDADHAEQLREDLREYHEDIADALDQDTSIVFREAEKTTFEAATELYPDNPFTIWIYPEYNYGWKGLFTPQVRFAKTFHRPDHADTYFLASGFPYADGRVQQLAQQEYLWEADRRDGVGMFTQPKRGYEIGGQPSAIQRAHLIPRITELLYDDAAEEIGDLIVENPSFRYVAEPIGTACRQHDAEDFHHVYDRMADQADVFETAHAALDAANEHGHPVDGWLGFYYRYTGLAAEKADLEATAQECCEQLCDERHHEAIGVAERAIKALPDSVEACDRVRSVTENLPNTIDGLDEFDPVSYESTFGELLNVAESVREAGGLKNYLANAAGEAGITASATAMFRTDRTVTYGYATVIGLEIEVVPEFELWDDLGGTEIVIDVSDADGNHIITESRPGLRFEQSWIRPRPVTIDLGDPIAGPLEIDISVHDETVLDGHVLTEDGSLVRPAEE